MWFTAFSLIIRKNHEILNIDVCTVTSLYVKKKTEI